MSERSEILLFDKFGTPSFEGSSLAELVEVEPSMLAEIVGGTLDAYCGDGDLMCGNLVNAGFCTNVGCGNDLSNGACITNGVCV